MNENTNVKLTTSFCPRKRKSHIGLLVFAGLETVSSSTISIEVIQKKLLVQFPQLITRFPEYESYFAVATWTAFFGGLFFFIFPMSITLWLGRYLVGISLAYIILGTQGITELFPIAFYIVYWIAIISPIGSRIYTMDFYKKHTKLDLPIFLVMSIGLIIWGYLEFSSAIK